MSKIILYGIDISPPVRACKMILEALNIPYEYKTVNLMEKEHKTTVFKKRNPMQTVPVLEDDGNFINDSHAICAYLMDKYGKTDELYPKDLLERARVNASLFFDASRVFMSLRNISIPLFLGQTTVISKEKIENVRGAYDILEEMLTDNEYLAGSHLTIAEFSCYPLITSLNGLIPIDGKTHPNIVAWLARISKISYINKIDAPHQEYIALLKSMAKEIQM